MANEKRGRGRPRGLTPWTDEQTAIFFERVATGASLKDACWTSGVKFDTMQARRMVDPEFEARLQGERSKMRGRCLETIFAAVAKGDVKAATWILERTAPETYSQRLEVTNIDGQAPDVLNERREREHVYNLAAAIRTNPAAVAEVEGRLGTADFAASVVEIAKRHRLSSS